MVDQKLHEELEKYIKHDLKCDLFGVADLRSISDYIKKQGNESLSDFPYGISIGIHLSDSIIDQLLKYDNQEVQFEFTYHVYNIINEHLDDIAVLVTQWLQKKGYKALPIPSRNNLNLIISDAIFSNPDDLRSAYSHKLTANLAGLGWIGKSCLLVTPEFGPRVWLTTVLTDAPLLIGKKMENRCGKCISCIKICPANAIKDKLFDPEEDRDMRFDAVKCHQYRRGVLKQKFGFDGCGLCMAICPYGKKNPKLIKNKIKN